MGMKANFLAIAMIFFFISTLIHGEPCPNECSGRGRCTLPNQVCECFEPYTGADCSLKSCPLGTAWVQIAVGVDKAHEPVECSNMGICDQQTGTCICREGFEGNACERLSCLNNCQGVGDCQSLSYYASTKDPGYGTVYSYSDVWDADKIYSCNCDNKYQGIDCSIRTCPVGDDPLTGGDIVSPSNPAQYNEIQQISCKATGGKFTLSFRGKTTGFIPFNAKAYDVKLKLESLPTLGKDSVKVSFFSSPQACSVAGSVWTIEFLQAFGALPLIQGNSRYLIAAGAISSVVLEISHLVVGSKESLPCSNRGVCDANTGICECSQNFESSNGYNSAGRRGDCGYEAIFTQTCPGILACSGHGYCSDDPLFVCQCSDGWVGADCSERACPSGLAWFGYPEEDQVFHLTTYDECSRAGICDRITGTCKCQPGFTGDSCDRLSCPPSWHDPLSETAASVCSEHGVCYDISTLATLATINGESAEYTYGATPNNPITWDYNRIYGCYCDKGFKGYDCSLRTCPSGPNPDAIRHQVNEIQQISCTSNSSIATIQLNFRQASTGTLSSSITTTQLQSALESLDTIGKVSVQLLNDSAVNSLCTSDGNAFVITFLTNPGHLPLIDYDVQGPQSFVVEELQAGTKEDLECNGRGLCNSATGTCNCFDGYGSSDGQGNAGSTGDCGYIEPINRHGLSSNEEIQ